MAKKCEFKSLPDSNLERRRNLSFDFLYPNFEVPKHLKEFAQGKKYFVFTFGCQANYRDSEILGGLLEKAGFSRGFSEEDADLIILNTCAVRENAEQKVFGKIGNLIHLKRSKPELLIGVCGCMVQQKHIIEYINEKFKHVDLIFGTHNTTDLLDMLNEVITKRIRLVDVKSIPGDIVENLPSSRESKFKAFVNISYGCDKFCTYCIVPYTRGKERSRKMSDILNEVQELKDNGYKEVTLLGQNVNAYGKDFNDGTTFSKLLEEVAKIGIPRVRFLTSHPWDFTSDLIDVIAKYDNIMKYIHLPVQSGSNEILKLMGRRYTREQYIALAKEIKTKIPDVALTTDIIVGFPNETYEQFLDTVSLCKEVHYDSAFTFIYSPRNNTPAAKIKDNVSPEDKVKRFKELVKALEEDISKHAENMIGKVYDILVEGPSEKNPEMLSGYTEKNKLVHFKGGIDLVGQIVKVKILESHTYSMIGELINE